MLFDIGACFDVVSEGISIPMVMARSEGDTSVVRFSGEGRSPWIRLCMTGCGNENCFCSPGAAASDLLFLDGTYTLLVK